MASKYKVDLTDHDRERLLDLTRHGKSSVRKVKRAMILRKASDGLSLEQIAEALDVGTATVSRTRRRYAEEGLESALDERARPGQRRKLSWQQEAYLFSLASTDAPEGYARWTLRLLAYQAIELGFADSISHETIRQALKRMKRSSRDRSVNSSCG